MDRVYTLNIDSSLDTRVKEFQKQLNEGEEIVSTVTAGDKLIITTRESKVRHGGKKLLLENRET